MNKGLKESKAPSIYQLDNDRIRWVFIIRRSPGKFKLPWPILYMQTLEDIIVLIQRKDARAERQLFDRTATHLKSVALRYVSDHQKAEDVLQESYLRIFASMMTFQYINDAATMGWMRRIVATESLRYLKKHQKVDYKDEMPEDPVFVEYPFESEDLMTLLNLLPEKQRVVFNLYAIEGYGHKEIADLLGLAESSSRSLLTRARSFLQKYISKKNDYASIR